MIYDFNDPLQYLEAMKIIEKATERKLKLEIKKVRKMKTTSQINYLHFLIEYFATQYGCTVNEAKEVYLKRYACPHIFRDLKPNDYGMIIETYKSTADLTIPEMSSAINNFIEWARIKTDGLIILPYPEEKSFERYAQQQIEKNQGNI